MEINKMEGIVSGKQTANTSSGKTISVSNNIIPVLDLHETFQIPPLTSSKNMFIVLVLDSRRLAVAIDKIEGIYDIPYHNLYSVPFAVQNRTIKKIAVLGERLIPVFAPE